jgi:hypothetical protein
LDGQVLWNRSEVTSAREIIGNPIAAAPPTEAAVAVRNFRRVIERWDFFRVADFDLLVFLFIASSLLQVVCESKDIRYPNNTVLVYSRVAGHIQQRSLLSGGGTVFIAAAGKIFENRKRPCSGAPGDEFRATDRPGILTRFSLIFTMRNPRETHSSAQVSQTFPGAPGISRTSRGTR